MKLRIVKYSISWLALILLIGAATMGLAVSFQSLEPGAHDIVFLTLAWVLVVASGIWLFIYASKENLRRGMEKEEAKIMESKPERKRESKKAISETDSLDIDSVARKIVRRTSPDEAPAEWGKDLLAMLSSELEIMSGVFFHKNNKNIFESVASFASSHAHEPYTFKEGEGLTGQVVMNKQLALYTTIPDDYSEVFSGLGKVKPSYLAIVPIIVKNKCIAVFECAGFKYTSAEIEHVLQIVSRELAAKIADAETQEKE